MPLQSATRGFLPDQRAILIPKRLAYRKDEREVSPMEPKTRLYKARKTKKQGGASLQIPSNRQFGVQVTDRRSGAQLRESETSTALIDGISMVMWTPGIKRDSVFGTGKQRKVFAYSVLPTDLTKIVREDSRGKRMIGHLVDGQFKAIRARAV